MSNFARKIRLIAAAAFLGLGAGAFAATNTAPLYGSDEAVAERGHGHIEPDNSYFCHCSGTACHPCAKTEQ